jgi:hypothetical protein
VFCMGIRKIIDNFYNIHRACKAQSEINFFRSQVNPNSKYCISYRDPVGLLPTSDRGGTFRILGQKI